jgi:hypothetical protein
MDAIAIPPANEMTLEMAVQDSPYFRENVDAFEHDLDELVKWLDAICKGLKSLAEELSSM